jgi:hypothetical protein
LTTAGRRKRLRQHATTLHDEGRQRLARTFPIMKDNDNNTSSGDNNNEPEPEVIFSYSRAEAIEDGVLVDYSDNEVIKKFWKIPFAATDTVASKIDDAIRDHKKDLNGILHDISYKAQFEFKLKGEPNDPILFFKVNIGVEEVELKLHIGPGDKGEPVFTLMLPHED